MVGNFFVPDNFIGFGGWFSIFCSRISYLIMRALGYEAPLQVAYWYGTVYCGMAKPKKTSSGMAGV